MYGEDDYSNKTGSIKKQEFCKQLDRMKLPSLWTYTSELVLLQGFLGICEEVNSSPKPFFHESGVRSLASTCCLVSLHVEM